MSAPKVPPPVDLNVERWLSGEIQLDHDLIRDLRALVAEVRRLREERDRRIDPEHAKAAWEAAHQSLKVERDQLRAALASIGANHVKEGNGCRTCDPMLFPWPCLESRTLAALALPSPPSSDHEKSDCPCECHRYHRYPEPGPACTSCVHEPEKPEPRPFVATEWLVTCLGTHRGRTTPHPENRECVRPERYPYPVEASTPPPAATPRVLIVDHEYQEFTIIPDGEDCCALPYCGQPRAAHANPAQGGGERC